MHRSPAMLHTERTTLKQSALRLGFVGADEFERLADPKPMRNPYPLKKKGILRRC